MRSKNFSFYLVLFREVKVSFALTTLLVGSLFACNLMEARESVPQRINSREAREVRVFLKTQYFGFYEKGSLIFSGPVCTGKSGCETPKGKFRVLMKAKGYVSKKFGAPMPFAVQFTTGGHFLHEGVMVKKPASHGCVRLTNADAKRIFCSVKVRDLVTIE